MRFHNSFLVFPPDLAGGPGIQGWKQTGLPDLLGGGLVDDRLGLVKVSLSGFGALLQVLRSVDTPGAVLLDFLRDVLRLVEEHQDFGLGGGVKLRDFKKLHDAFLGADGSLVAVLDRG